MTTQTENTTIEATSFRRADATQSQRKLVLKPVPIALGAIFLVLFVAAAFMFSAKAVRFNITPIPSETSISGGFTYQLGERYLMLPGDYSVRAELAGYHPLETSVTVGDAADQDFDLNLRKLPGILKITTEPEVTAEVFVDQEPAGSTPLELNEIEPGLHDISLQSERYLTYQTEISIEGKREVQSLNAMLEPAWADITVTSNPDAATIIIDGTEVGQTPTTIEVLEGERTLQLQKPGFKLWQQSLSVVHSQDQELSDISLIRSDGTISINSTPPGANVTINERYRGQTPLAVKLRPGDGYKLLLSKAGYEQASRRIDVNPDQDLSINLTMNPVVGVIKLRVTPAGGELFVDGVSKGDPSQQLTLTASRHTLEIRKPGYATYSTTVTPQPGLSQQLLVTLQTEEEARVAAIPQTIETPLGQELRLVLPGELKMGAERRERGRRSNEVEKDVLLTRSYYLGKFEVTNAEFKQFEPSHDPGFFGRATLDDDERPVVNVSWSDAVRFCNWLSEKEGLPVAYHSVQGKWELIQPVTSGYRLPTEAEWAYAARYADGEPTRFPWGATMPPPANSGNFADESALNMVPYHIAGYNDSYRGPAPVGLFPANSLGIHDLAGNVSEWISDYYSVALERELLTDPSGPDSGDYYVIRGSNYTQGRFSELRWTFRDYGDSPRRDVGFRLARYLE